MCWDRNWHELNDQGIMVQFPAKEIFHHIAQTGFETPRQPHLK
jgi:hypothetical protein